MLCQQGSAQEEQRLLTTLWTSLQTYTGISTARLRDAVLSILNLPPRENESLPAGLARDFQRFALNRIAHKPVWHVEEKGETAAAHTPRLNSASVKLAQKAKERRANMFKQQQHSGGKATLSELLVMVKRAQEDQLALERKRKEEQAIKDCTFRPDIGKNKVREPRSKREKQAWISAMAKSAKKPVPIPL